MYGAEKTASELNLASLFLPFFLLSLLLLHNTQPLCNQFNSEFIKGMG
jgi:hypothetical protein